MAPNPFLNDPDRRALWEMLVERDIEAFAKSDWAMIEADFDAENFAAIDARHQRNPDNWRIGYPTLAEYRDEWLRQSAEARKDAADLTSQLYDLVTLNDIEIKDARALLHKKFDGYVTGRDGKRTSFCWETIYMCRKAAERWLITGFVGFLPGQRSARTASETESDDAAKRIPPGATQHVTAGPYQPVLQVKAGSFVVISGQCALDDAGNVVGDSIEEQTERTLVNCARQLETAGVGFASVFKVNVYLRDLAHWDRFNRVYRAAMPAPLPVRTAIGAQLLPGLQVEVEMWAVAP